jgi:lipid-binding SYLF domain-containing protein
MIVISAFLACLGGGVAGAQDKPADTMELLREKARTDKKLVVATALNLTEGEAKVFWPVYNSYQSDMITYYNRVSTFLDTFAQAHGSMTDATATKLLGEFLALEADHVAILKSYAPKFGRVLPPVKVVRLYKGREQDARARGLRAGPRDSAGQMTLDMPSLHQVIPGERTMFRARRGAGLLAVALVMTVTTTADPAIAASAAEINRNVDAALASMYASVPETRQLASRAKAVLVFPNIVKAGFLFGAQYGEGALRVRGKTVGYYNSAAASYGLQAGVQAFGYALFFMSDSARDYLSKSGGFELGVGPSIVVLDAGTAKALTTTTVQNDIYAVFFDQKGLMAGLGLQGSKISQMDK